MPKNRVRPRVGITLNPEMLCEEITSRPSPRGDYEQKSRSKHMKTIVSVPAWGLRVLTRRYRDNIIESVPVWGLMKYFVIFKKCPSPVGV